MGSTEGETRHLERPRLHERALPRLHFVEGKCRVLLHDVESGDVIELGPREWALLAHADGTRDVDGLLLAGARDGVRVSREEVIGLLRALDGAGMLAEGIPQKKGRSPASSEAPSGVAPEGSGARVIERLAGYGFHCDGHGSCCQLYATVVFSPLEAARARSLLPVVLDGGERHEHVFMPERGAGPCAGSAVALIDGRCAYLDGALCALHRAGGADSKPLGCNLFPLSLVDDGRRVRASVSVECACVLESLGKPGGAPILPDAIRTRADLDPAIVVDELPREVELRAGVRAPLAEYLAWSDAALDALLAGGDEVDAAQAAWALASAVEAHGLDVERAREAFEEAGVGDLAIAAAHVKALGRKAARRAKAQNSWRSEKDLCRRGVNAIAGAATLLADPEVLAAVALGAGAQGQDERFYLRAALFGHQMVGYPLVTSLRDRAVAMWIARVFPLAVSALYPGEDVPAFAHPLALVEALLRGHGLRLYTEELGAGSAAS
ncbi:MAG: YkgJ family cysteine cluster protein [Polyangiaceae bacterium]